MYKRQTSNSVSKSITITQSAGAKVYGNWSSWSVNINADKTSIGATGGTCLLYTSLNLKIFIIRLEI